ncbi:SirB2 family protein [Ferrimonas gelatinilytica]|uniref:SirB2 family protein n=1 Tax=Ferrimonas gelatinilytica TaxID=1255257 RepID=A0ABP9RS46_9GAMM
MMYEGLKHTHLTLIGLSVGLFVLRFIWSMMGSGLMQRKWVKIVPHVLDTLLLLSGIALIMVAGWMPLRDAWLTEKLLAMVAYIFLGVLTFKLQRGRVFKVVAFLGALGWVYYMAVLAVTKSPMLLS